jgi:hypothetical protein
LSEIVNKSCGLDIHKHFFIATILSISGEKQQQRFARDDDGILALKNWVISEKCDVVACESTSDFWVPIYDSLIKHLPVIIGNGGIHENPISFQPHLSSSVLIYSSLRW